MTARTVAQNIILCMKWGDKYGAQYVNRLYNMVQKHLTLPFKMVCLTDNATGIVPEVDCLPLISLDLPAGLPERGWNKLTTFSQNLHGLQGTALFLDIDIVILDNIDCFFEQPHSRADEVFIIKDWKKPWRGVGNSSVYRFEIGQFPDLLPYFRQNFNEIRQQFRHEQAFLSWYIKTYHQLSYWDARWCRSYKYHALKPLPFSLWQAPTKPENCKILIFHGEVNPPDAITGGGGKWYRHVLPAPWLKDYWQ